ncbi:protein-tyrosine phosphatase-like protein [Stachybotrys elegans]|uniref:Protein-tyrosine phosphatase-like protein n=1 Tax=Stachybotrys elegans TaxID=80388 RepID=A0A8K0WVR7_9HYPO|nr:protein-tyrosine phosphatase-like protein [Stachybotrys elegans]
MAPRAAWNPLALDVAESCPPSAAINAIPAAEYERIPMAPVILLPYRVDDRVGPPPVLQPSLDQNLLNALQLTEQEVETITGNTPQVAGSSAVDWTYEQRRKAQRVLDFLHLGPVAAIRDTEYLQSAGITMIIIVRDFRMSSCRMLSVENAAQKLNIQVHYIDLGSQFELVREYPTAVRLINDHMLSIHRVRAREWSGDAASRRGRVLVACDSGNDRSCAIVTAYIMAMYGQDMFGALTYVAAQRFSLSLSEDYKRMLQTWEDLLKAQLNVSVANVAQKQEQQIKRRQWEEAQQHSIAATNAQSELAPPSRPRHKRSFEDTMDEDWGANNPGETRDADYERFTGRNDFAPFVDGGTVPGTHHQQSG